MKTYEPHVSSIGRFSANIVAAACYAAICLVGPLGYAIVFAVFISEKNSGLVKFHAMQALVLGVVQWIIGFILRSVFGIFPILSFVSLLQFLGWMGSIAFALISAFFSIIFLVLFFLGGASAFRWNAGVMPIIGKIAQAICNSSRRPAYTADGPVPPHCAPDGWSYGNSHSNPSNTGTNNTSHSQNSAPTQNPQGRSPHGPAPTTSHTPSATRFTPPVQHSPKHNPNDQLPPGMRDNNPPQD